MESEQEEIFAVDDHGNITSGQKTSLRNSEENDEATYLGLLRTNRNFRLNLLAYFLIHCGQYVSNIASIALIEEILGTEGPKSRTTISMLVVVRLVPNVLLSPFGGILADGWDRRKSMIALNILGAVSPLLFFLAIYFESINVIFLVTFLQQCLAGLYEPCRSAIIPLMVPEEDYLKKATTLAGLSLSLSATVGSSLGGLVLSRLGFKSCFIVDSFTYLMSALLMWLVGGTWSVVPVESEDRLVESISEYISGMAFDGIKYLYGSFWGALVLLKATGAIIYGAAEVLNVTYSEPNGIKDNDSPTRLGLLFAFVGVGCFVGPLLADPMTNMKRPTSIQKACIVSVALMAIACLGMGLFHPFWSICTFTIIRAFGSSTNWIYSSLLLQKFCSENMMGRVLAIDYALAVLAEAASAYTAGALEDRLHLSANDIAFGMASLGGILTLAWSLYHALGCGAAEQVVEEDRRDHGDDGGDIPAELTELVTQDAGRVIPFHR